MKRGRIQKALDASQRYHTAGGYENRAVVTFRVSPASAVDTKVLDDMQRRLWGIKSASARRASGDAARVEFLVKTFESTDNASHAVTILAWVKRVRRAGGVVTVLKDGRKSAYHYRSRQRARANGKSRF